MIKRDIPLSNKEAPDTPHRVSGASCFSTKLFFVVKA